MPRAKPDIITFKVDAALGKILKAIPNRSQFIRAALLNALENTCPLCQGTGLLSPDQRKHWEAFAQDHVLRECDSCREVHLVCECEGRHDVSRRTHKAKNK
jgi:hypothetical protein